MDLWEVERERGHIAVEVSGAGPLLLCIPGMGESRASFRHLVPGLVRAGYRVAVMDLRGHGESSATFTAYDDPAAASDALAIIDLLGGGPATIIGNSMGAAAAVLAAAQRPPMVERLVLIGPFVRDHGNAATRLLLRLLLMRPWGPTLWRAYYSSLFGQPRALDHAAHTARAIALLRRPGRWRAFQATTRTSHAPAEAALATVSADTLVIMGEKDRDFPDPAAEAEWVANALHGEHRMVVGAGHYPMGEQPQAVLDMILPFLRSGENHG
ncbi:alpha/beta fold hydrolase [Microbacterium amylolyticum]|uniref:Pimeloyl-ACP methyl ester carboxylesterase n=1 Tax=Microbacterium amylolyticum TaxID=936337 RepID=A0ABS4ZGX4_9MICO|nr:alpha/beta hydrolase [Microbacterium amylolyticum]MBP2436527.1 pimeloyl-ACP methyl ester carboxylesterase [Microbacterium amylolyticum]